MIRGVIRAALCFCVLAGVGLGCAGSLAMPTPGRATAAATAQVQAQAQASARVVSQLSPTPQPPAPTHTTGPDAGATFAAAQAGATAQAGALTAEARRTADFRHAEEWEAGQLTTALVATIMAQDATQRAAAGFLSGTATQGAYFAGASATARQDAAGAYAADYAREAAWQALTLGSRATAAALTQAARDDQTEHEQWLFWEAFGRVFWGLFWTAAIVSALILIVSRVIVYDREHSYQEVEAGTLVWEPGRRQPVLIPRPPPFALLATSAPSDTQPDAPRDDPPPRIPVEGGWVSPSHGHVTGPRADVLRLLRAAMRVANANATKLPGFRDIPEYAKDAAAWQYAKNCMGVYFQSRRGNGGGNELVGEYATLGDLYVGYLAGEAELTPPPARVELAA